MSPSEMSFAVGASRMLTGFNRDDARMAYEVAANSECIVGKHAFLKACYLVAIDD
jgi:hypothetical protein